MCKWPLKFNLYYLFLILFYFIFISWPHGGIWKFLGPGSNLSHSCNLCRRDADRTHSLCSDPSCYGHILYPPHHGLLFLILNAIPLKGELGLIFPLHSQCSLSASPCLKTTARTRSASMGSERQLGVSAKSNHTVSLYFGPANRRTSVSSSVK